MTAQLTIKDLNCKNCTNRVVNANDDWFCKVTREEIGGEFELVCTEKHGCCHHPLALQVLAAPVIEELGKEEKEQIEIYQNATAKNEEVYHQGIVFVIQMAIKLLKEGVKKP